MRVFAFLGEGNWLAKVNLQNLLSSKRELLFKALKTDLEAFRPGAQKRIDRIVFGEEGLCEVFPYDAASSLDPDEAGATLRSPSPPRRRPSTRNESTRSLAKRKTSGTPSDAGWSAWGSSATSTSPCAGAS